MTQPLCVDLFCGLGGWTEGFLSEGWRVVGFDIEQHVYGEERYPAQLVLQDVRTIHGTQFKDADMIVASSPCQEFSYRAMPWKRAKALGPPELGMELFAQARRIQLEAIEAAGGRYIPMIQENVRGAEKYVGKSAWHYGSFYLWGDVPALMPVPTWARKNSVGSWFTIQAQKVQLPRNDPRRANNPARQRGGTKVGGDWFGDYAAQKAAGTISPGRMHGKGSKLRKAASARIAKIPFPLAQYIAYTFHPDRARAA